MKAKLTKGQQAVLDAISALMADEGRLTYETLAERLGMASRGEISSHLVSLRKKGRIEFSRKLSSVRIIEASAPSSAGLLRNALAEAAEALAAEIGSAQTADALALLLAKQRAKGRELRARERHHPVNWRRAS